MAMVSTLCECHESCFPAFGDTCSSIFLLYSSLPRHPVTEHLFSQEPGLIKARLREHWVCLHLLFLKSKAKPSICCINTHCATLYLQLHPKFSTFARVLQCCKFPLTFPRENSKKIQDLCHQTDAVRKHDLARNEMTHEGGLVDSNRHF